MSCPTLCSDIQCTMSCIEVTKHPSLFPSIVFVLDAANTVFFFPLGVHTEPIRPSLNRSCLISAVRLGAFAAVNQLGPDCHSECLLKAVRAAREGSSTKYASLSSTRRGHQRARCLLRLSETEDKHSFTSLL